VIGRTLLHTRRATLRRTFVAVGVAVVMAGFATPAAANPKPPVPPAEQPAGAVPGGFKTWAELISVQDKLNAVARDILAASSQGYAGIVAAPENRELRVYWQGELPRSVRQVAGRSGVPVKFLAARFTERELTAEAKRVAADPRVASAAPKVDGSGLDVKVTAAVRRADQPDLLGTARFPLDVTASEQPKALISRQDDTPAFWGGSRYQGPVGGCTNGFALSVPGIANIYEITAGHCGSDGQGVTVPGQPSPTGTILADVNDRDTMVIAYPSGVSGAIYTGPFDSSTAVAVGGAVADFVGNWVCTGGSFSGEHCNINVLGVNQFVNVGYVIGPETLGVQVNGTCAAAPGDSGGPVYSLRSDGRVDARGIISAGFMGTPCPGLSPTGSVIVWYAPLLRPAGDSQFGALQYYGVGVVS